MHEERFDALTRQTAEVVSRRSSLLTLGGAAVVGALSAPAVAFPLPRRANTTGKRSCDARILAVQVPMHHLKTAPEPDWLDDTSA
jgi:hypothetical protein